MSIYAVYVRTGYEPRFQKVLDEHYKEHNGAVYYPLRELMERKLGKMKKVRRPVFPGYIFIEEPETLAAETIELVRKTPGFFRFLLSTDNIRPLSDDEQEIIKRFLSNRISGLSQVSFDENQRIIIKSGPLKGLEGKIVKVDKRKRRAKIKLDMYSESFLIDFGFELVDSV